MPSDDNSYPWDTGANIQNRLEMEEALITGEHQIIDGEYSNGHILKASSGININYKVISESKYMVEVHLGIASYRNEGVNENARLDEMIDLTINDNVIDLEKVNVEFISQSEYDIVDVAFFVPLKIGNNNISFTTKAKFVAADYFDINASGLIYDVTNE